MCKYATDHGERRLHQRLGLKKKAVDNNVSMALAFGLTETEVPSKLKEYFSKLMRDTDRTYHMYNRYLYVVNEDQKLITVLLVPREYWHLADKFQKKKKEVIKHGTNPRLQHAD